MEDNKGESNEFYEDCVADKKMDKPLSDKDKVGVSEQVETKGRDSSAATSGDGSAVPVISADKTLPVEISKKVWDQAADDAKHTPWMNQSPGKRLAIRTFSRGVMGAAFFTVGGLVAKKWMHGYDVEKGFFDQTVRDEAGVTQAIRNPLNFIAKLVDTVVGVPIEATVKAVTGNEELAKNSVLFRPTFRARSQADGLRPWGRSLGQEVVDVTFDFFCASIGDALGRDIIGFFDPNVKKDWINDKGHVDFPKAVHHALKSVTRYVTYNGGEDWAVAIPYVYFMKGQRKLIDHFSPGFKYDSDQSKFGGSFKLAGNPIGADGKVDYHHSPHVVGSYALEGMLDLQTRFTVYNVGTLMYREMYNYLDNRIHGKTDHLYGDPSRPDNKKMGLLDKIGETAKWMARSAIKGVIIMTPAVPFFGVFRANQFKNEGLFIHPELGMMTRKDTKDPTGRKNKPVFSAEPYIRPEVSDLDVSYSRYNSSLLKNNGIPFERTGPMQGASANPGAWVEDKFHPYRVGHGIGERMSNSIARGQNKISHGFDQKLIALSNKNPTFMKGVKRSLGLNQKKDLTDIFHPFARASMSYTPYMWAKAEAANLWDNGEMDMAAERVIDGAVKLNWREVKAGLGEVSNAILHKTMDDPQREIEAVHRVDVDSSAPEIFSDLRYKKEKALEKIARENKVSGGSFTKKIEEEKVAAPAASNWKERVIAGKAEDKPEIGANNPKGYAQREEMREALKDLQPPTNAIN
jgi:hypothetical protein